MKPRKPVGIRRRFVPVHDEDAPDGSNRDVTGCFGHSHRLYRVSWAVAVDSEMKVIATSLTSGLSMLGLPGTPASDVISSRPRPAGVRLRGLHRPGASERSKPCAAPGGRSCGAWAPTLRRTPAPEGRGEDGLLDVGCSRRPERQLPLQHLDPAAKPFNEGWDGQSEDCEDCRGYDEPDPNEREPAAKESDEQQFQKTDLECRLPSVCSPSSSRHKRVLNPRASKARISPSKTKIDRGHPSSRASR